MGLLKPLIKALELILIFLWILM